MRKLAGGCLLVVVATAVVFYAAWRQATRLPDWYEAAAAAPPAVVAADPGAGEAPAELAAPRGGNPAPAASTPRSDVQRSDVPRSGVPRSDVPRSDVPHSGGRAAPTVAAGGGGGGEAPSPPSPPPPPSPPAANPATEAGRLELDEKRLNDLLRRALAEHPRGRRLRDAVKAVRARLDGDRLELGVVASLGDLAAAADSRRQAAAVRRLTDAAPWLGERDFYFALRGRPRARDGHLLLDRDSEVQVGGITFDAADFASRLGASDEDLDRGLELPLPGLEIDDVEVADGALVLSLAGHR